MPFTPAAHTPYQWDNAPLTDTPLDATHLEAAETDLVTYIQSVATALDSYLEGILAPLASPAFTGTPTAPTPALNDNSTKVATTGYVQGQGSSANPTMAGTAAPGTSLSWSRSDHVHPTDTSRAPLASPGLTGTPTAPTAAVDTNTTQIATTAFVLGQTSTSTPTMAGTGAAGTSTRYARADHVHPTDTSRAPLASPVFTGAVSADTAGFGFQTKEGSNAKQGTAVLVAGTVTVANTSVTTSSRIFLTINTPGGTVGSVYVSARTAGTSFTITSTSNTDTSTVAYEIFEPAP